MRIRASRRAQSRSTRTRSPTAGGSPSPGSSSWTISPSTLRAARTVHDRPSAVAEDQAAIGRLAAAARVEDGPIEDHAVVGLAGLDRDDPRLGGAGVGVE